MSKIFDLRKMEHIGLKYIGLLPIVGSLYIRDFLQFFSALKSFWRFVEVVENVLLNTFWRFFYEKPLNISFRGTRKIFGRFM